MTIRQRRLTMVAVAGVSVAARLPNVWSAGLSQDEVASARILREPTLLAALHRVVRTESTPPLWYALGWAVHHAGPSVVDIRLLSVLFGGALAAVVFALASRILPPAYAVVAALLIAFAYEPVSHGAELRSYELLALLAAVFAVALLRAVDHPSRRLDVGLAATTCAGLLTHYFFTFSVVTAFAWLWLDRRAKRPRVGATAAITAGALAAAPWLPAFVAQFRHDRFWWIQPFSPRVVAVTPLHLFAPYGAHYLAAGIVVMLVLIAGAIALARGSRDGLLLGMLAFGPLAIAATLWAAGLRIYAVRNLLETTPFAAVALAAALAGLPRRIAAPAAATALASIAVLWGWRVTLPTPSYQGLARTLVADGWRPADPIAVFGNFFQYRAPLEWYLPHEPLLDVSRPTTHFCAAVFLVAPRHDGTFKVSRLAHVDAARLHVLRRATLLAALRTPPRCVRLSHDARLRPIA